MRWGGVGRGVRGWGIVCVLMAICGGMRTHAAPRMKPASAAAAPASSAAGGFRLGTAARPFAWSTAIGDLNADGRPDFAIADRVGRRPTGFAYAIELSIAGGRSASVAFDSDQDALSVSLRDVDHDRDLDVVVTSVVSRSIVAVWLNDGTGQFHRAAPEPLPGSWLASSLLETPADASLVGESVDRGHASAFESHRARGDFRLPMSTLATCGGFRTARASLTALRPRAPPPTCP
ncbi:MAG TPA: FG-GAP repeat protein [Vicinamibacterales bacterium]|nr:FG-GAP repeat protein [Vicinamibacterales bacterium]